MADYESADSRNSIQETGADLDRETDYSILLRVKRQRKTP